MFPLAMLEAKVSSRLRDNGAMIRPSYCDVGIVSRRIDVDVVRLLASVFSVIDEEAL